MAVTRPVSIDSGTELTPLGAAKKVRKPPGKKRVSLQAITTGKVAPIPEGSDTSRERVDVFHPRLFLTRVQAGRSSREYQADEAVFLQGDTADSVYYIESGKVKLTVVSTSGKEAVVAILPDGNFFGEGCLAGQPLRMATARTVQRGMITRVAKAAMVSQLHAEPQFAERFLAHLLSRNIRMEADLVDHLFNSSEKRLARLLLLMANFGQESKPIPLVAKMSQETLAEMIGTTRSRVSFFMNRFRELGFIEYDGDGMRVHSSLVSVVLHD
jgi:CRP-like cAMP-binding protein